MTKLQIRLPLLLATVFGLCSCGPTGSSKALPIGVEISNDSPLLSFTGWSNSEKSHRWTEGKSSSVDFALNSDGVNTKKLTLKGASWGEQHLSLFLNGKQIYSGKLTGAAQDLIVDIPADLLRKGSNSLKLQMPDAKVPGNGDPRVIGFSLISLKFQ
jgi:hypothetical protein